MSRATCPCCGNVFNVSLENVHKSPGLSPAQQRVVGALAKRHEGMSYDELEQEIDIRGTTLRNSVYAARDALNAVGWTIVTPGRGKDTNMRNNRLRVSQLDPAAVLEAV